MLRIGLNNSICFSYVKEITIIRAIYTLGKLSRVCFSLVIVLCACTHIYTTSLEFTDFSSRVTGSHFFNYINLTALPNVILYYVVIVRVHVRDPT